MRVSYLASAFIGVVVSAPLTQNIHCQNPAVRQEWRLLPKETQQSYVDAVKCLKTKPSRIGRNLTTTLYDDFPYIHAHLDTSIHFVASFLPWHRYFVHVYEKALQDCGYIGVAPYWDWTLDVANVSTSTIWDAESGFGGNGLRPYPSGSDAEQNCVQDGPFKDLRVEYMALGAEEHCLRRNFNNGSEEIGDMFAGAYTPEAVQVINNLTAYDNFRIGLENGPHGAIHSSIGGDMSPSTSPNDPIFFLHHGQIDRLWALWQNEQLENRTLDYSGIRTQDQFDGTTPPAASLEDIMPMYGLADDVAVKEYMSAQSGPLCYRY
ncbi:Tyrosinase ustQ [Colletotrichum higginsianum]|uniref:Tyrosinase ustQ n=1 Tax=Colletotrichum higginsianum TaxID=80884 RepID=A0A4T0VFM6_9PEZI|nr:Tyrosinase ustQ [Colletotrichum higginsianum]